MNFDGYAAGAMVQRFAKLLIAKPRIQLVIGIPEQVVMGKYERIESIGKLFHYIPGFGAPPVSFETPEEMDEFLVRQLETDLTEARLITLIQEQLPEEYHANLEAKIRKVLRS